jgi:hypothetical protein
LTTWTRDICKNSLTRTVILFRFLLIILFESLQSIVNLSVQLRARIWRNFGFCHNFRLLDCPLVYLHQVFVIKRVHQSNRNSALVHFLNQLKDPNPVTELNLSPDKEQYLLIFVECEFKSKFIITWGERSSYFALRNQVFEPA